MSIAEGIYLELLPEGSIKRYLTTMNGEAELEPSTVAAEVIEFSELSFQHYAAVLELISYWSGQVLAGESAEDIRKVDLEAFQEMVQAAYDLADGLSEDNPLYGTLTKTMLDDTIQRDDGSADSVDDTKTEIEAQLKAVMQLQFQINDALHTMSTAQPLDFENNKWISSRIEAIQLVSPEQELITQYRFRSLIEYYRFLFVHFILGKPNLAWCECCGRYFIPKTKKKTLYCDRVLVEGKTCKEMGPVLKHRQKASNNKVVAEFDRAKRRMYKRMERAGYFEKKPSKKDMGFSEYYAWLDKATAARDSYLGERISEEEALAVILDDGLASCTEQGTEGP